MPSDFKARKKDSSPRRDDVTGGVTNAGRTDEDADGDTCIDSSANPRPAQSRTLAASEAKAAADAAAFRDAAHRAS